jgi:hypothetical protein
MKSFKTGYCILLLVGINLYRIILATQNFESHSLLDIQLLMGILFFTVALIVQDSFIKVKALTSVLMLKILLLCVFILLLFNMFAHINLNNSEYQIGGMILFLRNVCIVITIQGMLYYFGYRLINIKNWYHNNSSGK